MGVLVTLAFRERLMGQSPGGTTFNSLTFKGTVTGGAYSAETFFSDEGAPFYFLNGSFDAPFKGLWNNGWHSTGVLSGSSFNSDGFPIEQFVSLNITTVTPEPSTFMMLSAGLLPVISVIRRGYLNR